MGFLFNDVNEFREKIHEKFNIIQLARDFWNYFLVICITQ